MNFETTIHELEQERELIDLAIIAVQNACDNRASRTVSRGHNVATKIPGKRKLTAAAKLRISQAMKKRWEARKAGKKLTVVRSKKAA